jgi:hypothetical protein
MVYPKFLESFDVKNFGPVPIQILKEHLPSLEDPIWVEAQFRKSSDHRFTKYLALSWLPPSWKLGTDPVIYTVRNTSCIYKEIEPIVKILHREYPDHIVTKALIVNLPSGTFITPHFDFGDSLNLCRRVHVPLVTHPDVFFQVNKKWFHFEEGHAYEINNSKEHGVINNSPVDRVHLIVDLMHPDNLKNVTYVELENGSEII